MRRLRLAGSVVLLALGLVLAPSQAAWARPAPPDGGPAGEAWPPPHGVAPALTPAPPRTPAPPPGPAAGSPAPAATAQPAAPPGGQSDQAEPSAQPAPGPPSPTQEPAAEPSDVAGDTAVGGAAEAVGRDVSYPQCDQELPERAAFAVVGVTGGLVQSGNPCLVDLLRWALVATPVPVAYYLNTANPGPLVSAYWPSGQASPRPCADGYPDNDSTSCAYDYGWNAALDAFSRAVAAAAEAGAADPATADWWLDVETANSWQALSEGGDDRTHANDIAALQGMADALRDRGVDLVGVYSTARQWEQITGGGGLDGLPVWYAGLGSVDLARAQCEPAGSFTGGPVLLSQYLLDGLDADLRC